MNPLLEKLEPYPFERMKVLKSGLRGNPRYYAYRTHGGRSLGGPSSGLRGCCPAAVGMVPGAPLRVTPVQPFRPFGQM